MVSYEVAAALSQFFDDGKGPSHDQLTQSFIQTGLAAADPMKDGVIIGKAKRVRAVISYAAESDAAAGAKLVPRLVQLMRAAGCFRSDDEHYGGPSAVAALRAALDAAGYDLADDGQLTPKSMEGLSGPQMTAALRTYARRARTAGDDTAARIGAAKELAEAAARHVLVEKLGDYPKSDHFSKTLFDAYELIGLAKPPFDAIKTSLAGNAWENVEQAVFLLAVAVNRFRNEEGTGHGRPHPTLATEEQSQIAAHASALVTDLLLGALDGNP